MNPYPNDGERHNPSSQYAQWWGQGSADGKDWACPGNNTIQSNKGDYAICSFKQTHHSVVRRKYLGISS
ncbi:MAG: hypothetical protein ACYDC1_11175, partial [Limisphaerales bacterium]